MEHTVRKNKNNRIALRTVAAIFRLVATIGFVYLVVGEGKKSILIAVFCVCCLTYGLNLLRQTLKPQAYDITYVFLDKTMTLKMHKKELTISYGDIIDLGYVVPNPSMDYSMIQIFIGKEQYVIPFTSNTNVAKALYGMLQLKKEEAKHEQEVQKEEK